MSTAIGSRPPRPATTRAGRPSTLRVPPRRARALRRTGWSGTRCSFGAWRMSCLECVKGVKSRQRRSAAEKERRVNENNPFIIPRAETLDKWPPCLWAPFFPFSPFCRPARPKKARFMSGYPLSDRKTPLACSERRMISQPIHPPAAPRASRTQGLAAFRGLFGRDGLRRGSGRALARFSHPRHQPRKRRRRGLDGRREALHLDGVRARASRGAPSLSLSE